MIEEYWGLSRRPFANTPDPAFTVRSPTFDEGFARLLYDVTELRGGLSLITGEVGCGKTMLAAALAERLAGTPQAPIALLTPRLTPVQLLRAVAELLGLEGAPRVRHALAGALAAHLAALHAAGRRPVLLVDEAQLVPKSLLEEIRLLTNYEDRTAKHLHVVLFGQPELRDRVAASPQLDQRISLRYHIEPLDADEVAAYVAHRLSVAGANGRRVFDDGAYATLAERSGGVPRLVNNLATQALFVGAMRRAPAIDSTLVGDVADDRE
jgi:type II secretory pathway predicted ATPase ExeA